MFQPVINGVGGNLVAVQASRISTELHRSGRPGQPPHTSHKDSQDVCLTPWAAFCHTGERGGGLLSHRPVSGGGGGDGRGWVSGGDGTGEAFCASAAVPLICAAMCGGWGCVGASCVRLCQLGEC